MNESKKVRDPKDMTVSEMLRKAGNGYEGASGTVMTNLIDLMGLSRKIRYSECFYALADKIDAELAQARELSLLRGAELWAKANGLPDFREGEDFGAWLDRCAFPKPLDEHGEPVQLGERIDDKVRGDIGVSRISYTANGHYFNNSHNSGGARIAKRITYAPGERVKRPAPEVLGADGLPIKARETVWHVIKGWEATVANIKPWGAECDLPDDAGDSVVWAYESITHTPPDTQERIDRDAKEDPCAYFGRFICEGCHASENERSCDEIMILDLLRRQRELDARKGGE